mmetsp:Transcript_123470/g.360572  ORF Transcript_123470/g.360572 Transcript_123470/m.360572 type:complete len:1001 (-) Transcript_123470:106-3108(-)
MAGRLAVICALAGGCSGATLRRSARAPRAASAAVRKPLTDDRAYEYATFDNGLKVLAVQDPRATKAGFAVAVEAGSYYDPPELPGLAHFCEHLLFLGTAKYPDATEWDRFMARHGGSNNAYTAAERTVYFNEVGHAGFDEGLDRFAQFFIAPLFKGEMVGRELEAVNSEHEKNKPDQGRRLWQILRNTAGQDTVLGRFYTGTVESLHHGDASTVEALRKYHAANYCAPRMSLVLVSNLTTAELLAAGRDKFSAVPRGSCGPTRDFGKEGHAFDKARLGRFIRMGTESTPALWMMFPLPPTQKFYKEAPGQYLQYVLAYAGPHSLKSRLKKRGLITDLSVQVDESSAATLLFFAFDLTPEGATDDGVGELSETAFSFLQLLSKESEGEVPRVYESLRKMSKVDFDYVEAPGSVMDAVSMLAAAASDYAPQDILTASNGVIDEVNAARVRDLLAALNPSNVNLALATPGFNTSSANRHEPYYDIHFSQVPVPAAWLQRWGSTHSAAGSVMKSPPPMRYVPTKLAVGKASAGKFPMELAVRANGTQSSAPLELWWKGRGLFPLPKAQLHLRLALPAGHASAENVAMRELHTELARQRLEEPLEDLRNCGLQVDVATAASGYLLELSGYHQYLGTMLFQTLESLLQPSFDPSEFARARRQVLDKFEDTTRKMPVVLAMEELRALTIDATFSREEVLAALGRLGEASLRGYLEKLSGEGLRAQLLVVGNLNKEEAQELAAGVAGRVSQLAGGLLAADASQKLHVLEASQPIEVRMRNPIPGDGNHATVASYQYGVADVAERVKLNLLGEMIANPIYDGLRTKQQLGYVVQGSVTEDVNVLQLRVLVQGTKKEPDAVEDAIEQVLEEFGASLAAMKPEEFKLWKESLRGELNHKDQNMDQEAQRYWSQIVNDGHCFDRRELSLQYLDTLDSVDPIVETFHSLRRNRRKVSVKLFGAGARPEKPVAAPAGALGTLLVGQGVSAGDKESLAHGFKFYPETQLCRVSVA